MVRLRFYVGLGCPNFAAQPETLLQPDRENLEIVENFMKDTPVDELTRNKYFRNLDTVLQESYLVINGIFFKDRKVVTVVLPILGLVVEIFLKYV